jgi:hypothetical protein
VYLTRAAPENHGLINAAVLDESQTNERALNVKQPASSALEIHTYIVIRSKVEKYKTKPNSIGQEKSRRLFEIGVAEAI